ncbi:MAG: tetratricopeptide repeat protein, partial [Leptospirales bacterium]
GRRFDEAGKIFAEVIADAPDEFYARLYLGRVHTMQRDYEKALSEFNRGVELNRKFFDLYYHRAVVRAKLRDPGGALSDLNQADRINPVNGLTDALRNSIKSGRN